MIPGIEPKIDLAFKKVFGSEQFSEVTTAVVNAVLETMRWRRVSDLELLNPYSERVSLDDKLSILDIKARDDRGRLYNLEMQMVASAALTPRLLYYWSKLYSQQLAQGDDYTMLRPTISICFVNGVLFPETKPHHSSFQLFDAASQLRLTDDLTIQVIELPKFTKTLDELEMPLDLWLYFLKNGAGLDADNLPAKLDTVEIRMAMRILKMLSQNEIERELYEGRLKAKRDMQTMETLARQARQSAEAAERRREAAERELEAAKREREAAKRELEAIQRDNEAAQRDNEAIQRDNEAIQRELRRELADRVRFCQRLLRQPLTDVDDLLALNDRDLRERVKNLEQDATSRIDPA